MGTLCCVLSGFCIFFSLQLTSKFKFTIFLIFNIIHIDYKVKKVCNIIQSIYVRIQRYILQKLNKVYKYIKKNIDFFGGGTIILFGVIKMKKTVLFIMLLGCMISEAEIKTIENKEVNDPTSIIISPDDSSKITNSNWSNIFGASDTITNSNWSNILGTFNKINNSQQTTAIGELNKIENSEYTKLFGNNNIINSSKYSYIFGTNIQAENSNHANVQGSKNIIKDSNQTTAIGEKNTITKSEQTTAIGELNEVVKSEKTKLLGNNNKINNSKYSHIFGGNIKVENSNYANVQGSSNTITKSKQTSVIGELNQVGESENTKLLGNNNKINKSKYSFIFGGNIKVENSNHANVQGNNNTITKSEQTTAIGANIKVENSDFGIAIGSSASLINAVNSVSIGAGSKATFSDSVALGSSSETKLSEKSAYLTDQKNNSHYVVSVGGGKIKRRIQGLADGAEDDEAVTVAQLKKLKSEVKGSTEKSDLALGGVANAIAMANLVQVNSYSDYRHNLSAAYGYYCGTQAVALGFSGVTKDRRLVYKLSGSVNNKGNLALGVGAGVMLGNKEESLEHKDINVKELYERITKLEKENSAIKQRMIEQDTIIQKLESIIRK